jgi:hypothetical protein
VAKKVLIRLGAAAVLVALLSGCAAAGGSVEEVRDAEAICRQIEANLAAQQGVLAVHADFLHSSVNPGDASVQLEVEPAADKGALTEMATRLIWQSHLDPLRRINIAIGTDAPVAFALPAQNAALEARYGQRPYVDREYSTGGMMLTVAAVAGAAVGLAVGAVVMVFVVVRRRVRA